MMTVTNQAFESISPTLYDMALEYGFTSEEAEALLQEEIAKATAKHTVQQVKEIQPPSLTLYDMALEYGMSDEEAEALMQDAIRSFERQITQIFEGVVYPVIPQPPVVKKSKPKTKRKTSTLEFIEEKLNSLDVSDPVRIYLEEVATHVGEAGIELESFKFLAKELEAIEKHEHSRGGANVLAG